MTDRERRALHQALVTALGEREADTLMEHLPPTGWGDLVRQGDLRAATAELRAEIAQLAAGIHRDMTRQTWLLTGTVLAAFGAVAGVLH